jgi:catechol 2,3-dioxygenase-like lactoylglutathione lyase family enzyme
MSEMPFTAIDHVQLAMPPGEEDKARRFYTGLLGLLEVPKPAELADRGGAWFESGPARIHLGVEANFRAAKKAHPAFLCQNYAALIASLRNAGVEVADAENLEGSPRCHIFDPFGNRIELVSA